MLFRIKVREFERAFLIRNKEFKRVLGPGVHWMSNPFRAYVEVSSVREPLIKSGHLDVIVKKGALGDEAIVLELEDTQRAIVWMDGRFYTILGPGLYALWTVFHKIDVEVIDAREGRFTHPRLDVILSTPGAGQYLEQVQVETGTVGLVFRDGRYAETLGAGRYALWKNLSRVQVRGVDMREIVLDIGGQEIMTADRVTLRLNALATYRVTDPVKATTQVDNAGQALYREAQLALRATVGTRPLDALLGEKDGAAAEVFEQLRARGNALGLEVLAIGLRDIILPGEMKVLLNKVVEAQKAAEANLITRREETAAMRTQLNTARILETNPTLMRLRELEVLEKVAEKTNLTVLLGEQGLADRVVKLL